MHGLRRLGRRRPQDRRGHARAAARHLAGPKTFGETLGDIRTVAQATDSRDAALDLIARIRSRVDRVRIATRNAEERPTVAALEWLDPVFTAGHWTPQLIEMAGGQDVLGFAGEPSEKSSWELVRASQPEVVVVMPCGYAVLRFLVDRAVSKRVARPFPFGTLMVNLSGALLLGLLAGLVLSPHVALLAGTAFVGSYTTFSTWMLETQRLGEERQAWSAFANIAVSVALGLAAAGLGHWIGAAL